MVLKMHKVAMEDPLLGHRVDPTHVFKVVDTKSALDFADCNKACARAAAVSCSAWLS